MISCGRTREVVGLAQEVGFCDRFVISSKTKIKGLWAAGPAQEVESCDIIIFLLLANLGVWQDQRKRLDFATACSGVQLGERIHAYPVCTFHKIDRK